MPHPNTPPIPPELETLSTNIQEIITSLEAIHSKEYAGLVMTIFAISAQIQQMESFGCENSKMVQCLAERLNDTETLQSVNNAHSSIHLMGQAAEFSLAGLIRVLESAPFNLKDIGANVNMILKRADSDFFSKHRNQQV